ncbi:Scr1 family TA system antitoxin-like transcriptional regulator [Nocardiopsis sp. NPDC006938]|uniref:Scr1 family TA system antitoxin-like transcriptional regulator n=1 Tax=Nocardiopsis sp. NPDC006938 TaxID=3364337 RepID=UPI0036818E8B
MNERTFASELVRLRAHSPHTQRTLAAEISHAAGSISNWERGKHLPSVTIAHALDSALGGQGGLVALWEDAKSAGGVPAHLRGDVALLGRSRAVEIVSPGGVPGLVQHPAYAHWALLLGRPADSPSAIRERVTSRCRVLDTAAADVRITVLFPTSALHAAPPEVARLQAEHLVQLIDAGRVTVHLVQGGLPGVTAPFSLYRLHDGHTAATTDHATGSVDLGPADVTFLQDVARAALADAASSTASALILKEKANEYK